MQEKKNTAPLFLFLLSAESSPALTALNRTSNDHHGKFVLLLKSLTLSKEKKERRSSDYGYILPVLVYYVKNKGMFY